jgi:HSP20 family molecular chaperone IbpA
MIDRVSKASAEGYPPYNIERKGENDLRITLAVAGFSMGDLTVSLEDNQLVIRGQLADSQGVVQDEEETVFLHRGIASRQFQRSFVLAERIEVKSASLDNGLLLIKLERLQPESKIRTIEIENGKTSSKKAAKKIIAVQPD